MEIPARSLRPFRSKRDVSSSSTSSNSPSHLKSLPLIIPITNTRESHNLISHDLGSHDRVHVQYTCIYICRYSSPVPTTPAYYTPPAVVVSVSYMYMYCSSSFCTYSPISMYMYIKGVGQISPKMKSREFFIFIFFPDTYTCFYAV